MKKIQKTATRMTWDEKSCFAGINIKLSIYLIYQKYSREVIGKYLPGKISEELFFQLRKAEYYPVPEA